MLELFYTDSVETDKRAESNVVSLLIDPAGTGHLDLKFNPNIPAQYEYLIKVVQVYPPAKDFTFRIFADPLADNNYHLVKEIPRTVLDTEALSFIDAALPICYKFPIRVEITNDGGGAETFIVYLSFKEINKDG